MKKYENYTDEEAGMHIILDEFLNNCRKFPSAVQEHYFHMYMSTNGKMSMIGVLASINALIKARIKEEV